MSIYKKKSDDGSEITIHLPEKFDFQMHSEFRSVYEEERNVKSMVLDMDKTQYMDSSALGMMLQLKEYADSNNGKVSIKNVHNNILHIIKIAHFDKLFTIA
jgi:HptB-dependent secretion and biofilm anti anti-sigma factor